MKKRPDNNFSQSLALNGTKHSTSKMSETAGKSMYLKDDLSPGIDSRNLNFQTLIENPYSNV